MARVGSAVFRVMARSGFSCRVSVSGMHEAYRDRIVATEDFQDNFAMVDVFVAAVSHSEARAAAVEWCTSREPLQRAAGLDVLCTLRADRAAAEALRSAAAEVGPHDSCEDLRWSAAHGLACIADGDAAAPLLRFLCDPDGDVRWQVAVGLGYAVATMADEDEALIGLRQLAEDADTGVRARAERSMREARDRLRPSASEQSSRNRPYPLAVPEDLHQAAAHGLLDDVQRLLDGGADVAAVDPDLRTPLHAACQQGHVEVAELLLREGAPVDVRDRHGNTPLWRATFGNAANPRLVRLLLDAGADPDVANDAGRSPRDMAATFAKPGVVALFR